MKTLVASILLIGLGSSAYAACSRPVDPKKVVLMLAFNPGSEEEKGAIEGACARGERLVILPTISPERKRLTDQIAALSAQYAALAEEGRAEANNLEAFAAQRRHEFEM
jgi:hypothetical protein